MSWNKAVQMDDHISMYFVLVGSRRIFPGDSLKLELGKFCILDFEGSDRFPSKWLDLQDPKPKPKDIMCLEYGGSREIMEDMDLPGTYDVESIIQRTRKPSQAEDYQTCVWSDSKGEYSFSSLFLGFSRG